MYLDKTLEYPDVNIFFALRIIAAHLSTLASNIMRTTLDLADPVLRDLKALRRKEGGSLGALASRLLADALTAQRRTPRRPAIPPHGCAAAPP